MKVTLLNITKNPEDFIALVSSICYNSDPGNTKRVKGIVKASHLSCLRFAHAVILVEGVSRACSHQLVRHKHLDYLQRSQRYVKESNVQVVRLEKAPWYAKPIYNFAMSIAWFVYATLLKMKVKPEDARMVLPNACYTKLVIVGNFQAWHDFLYGKAGRLQKAAQREIRNVAGEVEKLLENESPTIFGRNRAR